MLLRLALAGLLVLAFCHDSLAIERRLIKETLGAEPDNAQASCPLASNTNGSAANYRWYNICSGYIWLYTRWDFGEAVGVRFGGPEDPAVRPGNTVKRVITYFRDLVGGYGTLCQGGNVEVTLNADIESDGCPDATLATTGCFEPSLRWNCSEFNVVIPPNAPSVIVRQIKRGTMREPAFVTDGLQSASCDPIGVQRSFYYGINGAGCVPWGGPTGRFDNFLTWLIVDGDVPTATKSRSWGQVKALYR